MYLYNWSFIASMCACLHIYVRFKSLLCLGKPYLQSRDYKSRPFGPKNQNDGVPEGESVTLHVVLRAKVKNMLK